MSIVIGTNKRLIIEEMPDSDGELQISMAVMSNDTESVDTWLTESDARKLVNHLNYIFEI